MSAVRPTPQPATHERLYRTLRSRIMLGELPPGRPLTLRGLAAEHRVSMTPAREAVRRLAAEGALTLSSSGRVATPELSVERIEELDDALPREAFSRLELPWDAGFLAGKAFLRYRRARGTRSSPLPDFYIGAHAAIEGMALLTRDAKRYRTYYPKLELICP